MRLRAIILAGIILSFVQVHLASEADIRLRATMAVFNGSYASVNDPAPTLVAARMLSKDGDARLYDPSRTVGSAFIYPPLAAAFYHPIAMQPNDKIIGALTMFNHVLFVLIGLCAAIIAFRNGLRWPGIGLLGLAMLYFYPLTRALELNQATMLVTLLIGMAWVLLERNLSLFAGLAWALAVAIKPQLVLALPILWWRERRFVLATLAWGGVLIASSVAYAGWQNHVDYVTRMLPMVASGYAFYPNHSWNGLFNRLLLEMSINQFAIAPPNPTVKWLSSLFALLTYGGALFAAWRVNRRGENPPRGLLLGFSWLAATLASPIAWEHHYAPALFLFAELYASLKGGWQSSRAALVAIAVAGTVMASYFEVRNADGVWQRLLVSYVFFAALVMLGTLAFTFLRPPSQRSGVPST